MEDREAFCEFLSNREPPLSLSESTAHDAVEFLLSLPSDRINKVAGSLSAATFTEINGSQKENPFGSPMVRTFLKERVKEQTSEKEDESEIKGEHDDDKEILFEKCLTDNDVVGNQNCLLIAANNAEKYSLFASVILGGTTRPLLFEDEDGKPWEIYCTYVRQSYVFTKGWSGYVKEKQLGAGDFVFFQRHRVDSSRLFIGFRRRNDDDTVPGQRHCFISDPTSPATSSLQGASALGQWDNVLPDPTSPVTSFVLGLSTLGQQDNVLPDQTSSEMLELREKLKEDEIPLHLRLPEYSTTGFGPILVIFCGDNQDSEETYFISCIFKELCLRGFTPLRYDLTRSTVTGDLEMLYNCRVGIMIFSENYARSRECLDGFVAIMDHLKSNKLELRLVFFKVSLSDVINQSGSLGRAFLQLENSVEAPQVLKWRAAMIELISIKGYHQYMKGCEVMLVKNIVRGVCVLLNSETNRIKLALESILPLLHCSQPSAPHIVGLWGMAGIGKTTIAKELFRTQAERYDVCYFLPDFHIKCQTKGLNHLRDEFFSKIFGEENVFIDACDTKLSFTRDRFLDKRILIVLDGVTNARDAEVLVGGFGWFSGGHTIILTSRNRQVLVQCNVKEIYEIPKLSEYESLCLFGQSQTERNQKGMMTMMSKLVNYASGNPLALRVLGSTVQKICINDEKENLRRLRQHPPIEIQDAFRKSFNGLHENEKNIFLDLACFFRGENKDHVVNILDGCGFSTDLGIYALIDESLISLVDNRLEMPNIFQDTGRFVVCQENNEAGKRSRLWDSNDIADVLINNSGTEAIEGIFLDASGLTFELSPTVLERMDRLRLLKLHCSISGSHCKVCLPQGLHSLPDELRLLHWEGYPLGSLPRKFNPKNLVELNMPYSNMTKLWKGTKNLENLKRIILSHSRQLTKFPRLSKARNLEHIDLEGCTSLVKVNSSILHHHKLTFLSLKDCSHLRIIPTTVHLESLEVLNLSGCSELEDLQGFSPNLKELYLAGTAIKEIPSSIGDLTRLVTFDLENCNRLQHLPPEISNLKAVVTRSAKRSCVEDMTPPYKRCRLKRVIESVITSLRKRKRRTPVSRATNQVQLYSTSSSVSDPSYKSFWEIRVLPERPGQPECQRYMSTRDCKFGNACKFHHPRDRETSVPESSLSFVGLPSRPGKRLCALYFRTGNCISGPSCIFDHPSLASTLQNTSSMASETPHMNLPEFSFTLGAPSSELVEAGFTLGAPPSNELVEAGFTLGAPSSELVEAGSLGAPSSELVEAGSLGAPSGELVQADRLEGMRKRRSRALRRRTGRYAKKKGVADEGKAEESGKGSDRETLADEESSILTIK